MARRRRIAAASDADRGSVLPLVLGMTVMLLILVMAIWASGSVFLSRNRLQNQCDGAVLRASDAAGVPDGWRSQQAANDAAVNYLAIRSPNARVSVVISADTAVATCWETADVQLGEVFFTPTIDLTVTSTSQLRYRT